MRACQVPPLESDRRLSCNLCSNTQTTNRRLFFWLETYLSSTVLLRSQEPSFSTKVMITRNTGRSAYTIHQVQMTIINVFPSRENKISYGSKGFYFLYHLGVVLIPLHRPRWCLGHLSHWHLRHGSCTVQKCTLMWRYLYLKGDTVHSWLRMLPSRRCSSKPIRQSDNLFTREC